MTDYDRAAEALAGGELVVIPTDTVYGICARPDVPGAVRRVFEAKGRPDTKPLPVLGASLDALRAVATFHPVAEALADRFWPGALTMVLERAPEFTYELGAPTETVGVRVPAHHVALGLLALAGPIAVTSANRSGQPESSTIDAARAAFGDSISVYLDGGELGGAPSTVVALGGEPRILREGALPSAEILGAIEEAS